jgi:hypothetical protein
LQKKGAAKKMGLKSYRKKKNQTTIKFEKKIKIIPRKLKK